MRTESSNINPEILRKVISRINCEDSMMYCLFISSTFQDIDSWYRVMGPFSCTFSHFIGRYLFYFLNSGGSRISHRGGRGPRRGGRGLPRQLRFVKFVCQNERIGSLRGAHAGCAPPNPPMLKMIAQMGNHHEHNQGPQSIH